MLRRMIKYLLILFILFVVSLLCRACFAKPRFQVIAEFKMNREVFETVRDCYFIDGWENIHYDIYFFELQEASQHVKPIVREYLIIPEDTSQLDHSLTLLFGFLGYRNVGRTALSGNTIVFQQKMKLRLATGRFIVQGIAYAMDGESITPQTNHDIWIETVKPIGDNWYYWRGSQYPY